MAKPKTTNTSTPKAPKTKVTATETPKAPKTKTTRVDTNKWMGTSPLSGSGQSWSEWGKSNPNRALNAALADDRLRKTPRETAKTNRFKEDGTTEDPKREEAVQAWRGLRPLSGKGTSKSEEEKEVRRKKMIKWAKDNPNARDNARTALGRDLTRDGETPAAKAKKKTAPKKKSKKR